MTTFFQGAPVGAPCTPHGSRSNDLSTRKDRRRAAAATLIASAALALGVGAPAAAAPSALGVHAGAISAQGSGSLPTAVEVPIIEDPAQQAAGEAARVASEHTAAAPAHGLDMPIFLVAAVLVALLGLGLCVVAALRA